MEDGEIEEGSISGVEEEEQSPEPHKSKESPYKMLVQRQGLRREYYH